MPEYLSPGIYLEDLQPLSRPIEGVSTSVAGIIGVSTATAVMPLQPDNVTRFNRQAKGVPKFVTNWEEFKQSFGDFQTANQYLAHAVYGFFNNGGRRCYVAWVADLDGVKDVLDEFAAIDEISIVAAPMPPSIGGAAVTQNELKSKVHDRIVAHCNALGDRVAILESIAAPARLAVDATGANGVIAPVDPNGFVSLYVPWIKVDDPLATGAAANIDVPPSGHLAGIYARTDSTRGVFKTPANEFIFGSQGTSMPVSPAIQDGLNPTGVNCLRVFSGGVLVWGARTRASATGGNAQYRYVNVRRYINFLRKSLDQGLRFVVFEPNTPSLWQSITRTISDFLLGQWRDGALFGETPKQAFYVKCDSQTNPAIVREAGQVVTEIGVAIVKPAEFVILRIIQQSGG